MNPIEYDYKDMEEITARASLSKSSERIMQTYTELSEYLHHIDKKLRYLKDDFHGVESENEQRDVIEDIVELTEKASEYLTNMDQTIYEQYQKLQRVERAIQRQDDPYERKMAKKKLCKQMIRKYQEEERIEQIKEQGGKNNKGRGR